MSISILCDAIPFCYGPASALSAILINLNSLDPERYRFDVLATGATREFLAHKLTNYRLLNIDSENLPSLAELNAHEYSAFIDVCNPVSYAHFFDRNLPTVYVDFLLWMHSGPPAPHFKADLYIAERYPGTDEWAEKRGGEIPQLQIVPPLVETVQHQPQPGRLLIGLGGLLSKLTIPGHNTNYAYYVVEQALEALPYGRFSRITVACNETVARQLSLRHQSSRIIFRSLPHNEFLQELSLCEMFITHPGLYAAFEAMISGIPTCFLPPSNYTQVLQLRHFRRMELAEYSFAWEDLGAPTVPDALTEHEGVRRTLAQVQWAENQEDVGRALRHFVEDFASLNEAKLLELGHQQQSIAKQFGTNGPKTAATNICNWLTTVT